MNEHLEQKGKPSSKLLLFIPLLMLVVLVVVYARAIPLIIGHPLSRAPNVIVPGSKGIGNPPGAIQIGYDLAEQAVVTAKLEGPVSATILSTEQAAGSHVLRFNGVITESKIMDGYTLVQRVVPDGDYTIEVSGKGLDRKS